MRTEVRFLLAIALMLGVLVGTNFLFPPVVEEPLPGPDSVQVEPRILPEDEAAVVDTGALVGAADTAEGVQPGGPPVVPETAVAEAEPAEEPAVEERRVVVEGPLYRYTFSNIGARLVSADLVQHRSLRRDGPVQLIPEGAAALGHRFVVNGDTLDLSVVPFEIEPSGGLNLREGGAPEPLRLVYRHPTADLTLELEYLFRPDAYLVDVRGSVSGLDRALALTSLGQGLAFNEADSTQEAGMMAYVGNHLQDGIESTSLRGVEERRVLDGPYLWAAFKSKFFVLAVLPGHGEVVDEENYLGGIVVDPVPAPQRAGVAVTQSTGTDGIFEYQVFAGPLEYARLSALGDDLEEVNPYGWRFFRPIVRPFVAVIMFCLNFLHNTLNIGYGWVLILFGVLMRVLLWPLYMKSMRAQMNNMRVQPLLKEIQTKYKDQPEKLQKEMMKLYKEHGFNPVAGCLPMLLPWPVLIALFFVFQNTIELRGVDFLWLPDLSAKDPLFILPVFLAASMFLLQFISYRSMDQDNPQMKMMMWIFPLFFGFIFMNFASGLNLYYATANVATIPQQVIVARERKKVRAKGPVDSKDGG